MEVANTGTGSSTHNRAARAKMASRRCWVRVAAQVPCEYCVYFHTKAAKKFGATDAEIREAIAQAAQVRKWSTILNGSNYDDDAFEKEVDAMFE